MSDQQRKPRRDWGPMLFSFGGLVGLAGLWALDTFTVQGFLAAAWPWADTTGLLWAWGTRIVWWAIFWQVAIGCEMRAVWREGDLEFASHRQLWLASHVSLVHRSIRRGRWTYAAIPNAAVQRRRRQQSDEVVAPAMSGTVSGRIQDTPVVEPQVA